MSLKKQPHGSTTVARDLSAQFLHKVSWTQQSDARDVSLERGAMTSDFATRLSVQEAQAELSGMV